MSVALGVTSARAEAMATDAERLRHSLRPLFDEAGAGRARMSTVVKINDALEHLDDTQIATALPHLLAARAAAAGPKAAGNRTARVLAMLGLTKACDEIDLRAELGVWFSPHPEHPTLTELRAVLPSHDAADLKAAIHSHAQELRGTAPHVLDVALRDPIDALRADALVMLALADVHVTPVLHLQVPVARSHPPVLGGAAAPGRVAHLQGSALAWHPDSARALDPPGAFRGHTGSGDPDVAPISGETHRSGVRRGHLDAGGLGISLVPGGFDGPGISRAHSGSGDPDAARVSGETYGPVVRRGRSCSGGLNGPPMPEGLDGPDIGNASYDSGGPNSARRAGSLDGGGTPGGVDGIGKQRGASATGMRNGFGDVHMPGIGRSRPLSSRNWLAPWARCSRWI